MKTIILCFTLWIKAIWAKMIGKAKKDAENKVYKLNIYTIWSNRTGEAAPPFLAINKQIARTKYRKLMKELKQKEININEKELELIELGEYYNISKNKKDIKVKGYKDEQNNRVDKKYKKSKDENSSDNNNIVSSSDIHVNNNSELRNNATEHGV